MVGGGGGVLLCAQRLYFRRDQLDCPAPTVLNLPLNKTGAHSTGERFRAIMALLFVPWKGLTSWLSFVVSNCGFVTFPLVSWVRGGT